MVKQTTATRAVPALLLFAATLFLAPAPASAQVNAESFAKLGFNFNPPGARSAALGGAFIPLADDATAAETNPAGLTVLLYPQLSFELKGIEYSRTLTPEAGGGEEGREFADGVGFPSFASLVYPVGRWTFGLFRHELVNYRNTIWSAGTDTGLASFTSELDLEVQNVGGALAVRSIPNLSLGVSAGWSGLQMAVDFPRYRLPTLNPDHLQNQLLVDESGSGFFVNAGALLRFGERMSLGAVYRRRPEFEGVEYRLLDGSGGELRTRTGTLRIPDAFGGGISVRVTDLLTFTVDAVVNRYSQIAEEQVIIYNPEQDEPSDYQADDGTDLHGGIEYVVLMGQTPLSLRAGVSRLAASNVYYAGSSQFERDLFGTEPADDQTRFSGGIGLVMGRRLQLDAAGAVGDDRSEFVISLVYLFGRN